MLAPLVVPPPTGSLSTPRDPRARAKSAGRFQQLNSFVDNDMRRLNATAQSCWVVLYRNERDGSVQISHKDIAQRMNVKRVTVTRAIKRLKEEGLIEIIQQGGWKQGITEYRLVSTPPIASDVPQVDSR